MGRLWMWSTLWLLACGDKGVDEGSGSGGADGSGDGAGDDGGADGTCDDDGDCGAGRICVESACEDGDRDNAPEDARPLLWDSAATGFINPEGDVDWYAFEADGGEFVKVSVTLDEGYEASDTVLTLRKANGKVVTSADAFATGTGVNGVDAVVFGYLDEPGTWYLTVEDDGTAGRDADGVEVAGRDYVYDILLEEWDARTAEPDGADAAQVSVNLTSERIWVSVGALVGEAGDVDWLNLEHGVDGATLYLDGNEDLDGSDLDPLVRLWAGDGTLLAEKRGVGPSGYALGPALAAGSYRISVEDASGGGGANHWAVLHVISRLDEYAHTLESESNDSAGLADVLAQEEFENSGGNLFTRGQLQGQADGPADEDWFALEAGYGDNWVVACLNSAPYGSLVAPDIEIYDGAGVLVAADIASDASSPTAVLENLTVEDGTYFLRVVAPADAAGSPGEWYRANVFVASFEVGGYDCPDGS